MLFFPRRSWFLTGVETVIAMPTSAAAPGNAAKHLHDGVSQAVGVGTADVTPAASRTAPLVLQCFAHA
jgi:hypothetical protein